ncbi:MAG: SDR family oxidoreductase [Casimicrobiaceae bacterium]
MPRRVVIFGVTSAIAEATARLLATRGDALFVVGRDALQVQAIAADLRTRGAGSVVTACVDLARTERHDQLFEQAIGALGGVDVVLIAHGVLPDQKACDIQYQEFLDQFQVNALSVISLSTLAANYFAAQRSGVLAVVSSVAGDRGRSGNFAYGTSKAAVSTFLEGLGGRLHGTGVRVITLKPGFVDTPMTAHLKKTALWAQPGAIAPSILTAIDRKQGSVYLPWFWRPILFIVRNIPEWLLVRLKF